MDNESLQYSAPDSEVPQPDRKQLPVSKQSPFLFFVLIIIALVGVFTLVVWWNMQRDLASLAAIKPVTVPLTPTLSPPLSWQSYTDKTMGFHAQVASSWQVTQQETTDASGKKQQTVFTTPSYTLTISKVDITGATQFAGSQNTQKEYFFWLTQKPGTKDDSATMVKQSNVKIGETEAVEFSTEGHPDGGAPSYGLVSWVNQNTINYYILLSSNKPLSYQEKEEYNQFLSQFTFPLAAHPLLKSGWQTYTSADYGFSFDYPEGVTVSEKLIGSYPLISVSHASTPLFTLWGTTNQGCAGSVGTTPKRTTTISMKGHLVTLTTSCGTDFYSAIIKTSSGKEVLLNVLGFDRNFDSEIRAILQTFTGIE